MHRDTSPCCDPPRAPPGRPDDLRPYVRARQEGRPRDRATHVLLPDRAGLDPARPDARRRILALIRANPPARRPESSKTSRFMRTIEVQYDPRPFAAGRSSSERLSPPPTRPMQAAEPPPVGEPTG